MTRAIDRLIVAGSVDFGRPDETTPMGWVLSRLDAAPELAGAADGPVELAREGAALLVRVDRGAEEASGAEEADEPGADETQLTLFAAGGPAPAPAAPVLPALEPVPEPPLHTARKLSFTALATYERCAYRYFAERVVGMRPQDVAGPAPGRDGLGATEVGSAVHHLLETIDIAAPDVPADLEGLVRASWPAATGEDVARIRALVEAYCRSALARRLAALTDVRRELHFTFELDGVILHGYLDVVQRTDGRALVVDYKSNQLGDDELPEQVVAAEYRFQRVVYALACLREGADTVEVVYHFLERPDAPVSATFGQSDVPALEGELRTAIVAIHAGEFAPTPSERACSGCPALDRVCAGPRLRSAAGPLATVAG
jgi:ATP-dependent exoDNAse (exonuclease V) beta subunit